MTRAAEKLIAAVAKRAIRTGLERFNTLSRDGPYAIPAYKAVRKALKPRRTKKKVKKTKKKGKRTYYRKRK